MRVLDALRRAVPATITLGSLACGLGVILPDGGPLSASHPLPALLLLAAVVLDFLDGAAARALHVPSAFGRELDSLSDVVCFGVAPALLLTRALAPSLGALATLLGIAFAMAAVLRLARFNIWSARPDIDPSRSVGLTVPMAACTAVAAMLLGPAALPASVLAAIGAILVVLMVSTVPYRTAKGFHPGSRAIAALAVLAVLILVVAIVVGPIPVLAVASFAYVLSGPAEWSLR
jgi:CDP-diacylglycerol--serine O-phosphatidyltransferase